MPASLEHRRRMLTHLEKTAMVHTPKADHGEISQPPNQGSAGVSPAAPVADVAGAIAELITSLPAHDLTAPAEGPEAYKPPTPEERMDRTAKLTGDAIRKACETAAAEILGLVEEAERLVAATRLEAEDFAADIRAQGAERAKKIEEMLANLRATLGTISTERQRVAKELNAA